jgi:hypothetical protein
MLSVAAVYGLGIFVVAGAQINNAKKVSGPAVAGKITVAEPF